jgi:hypothetical protein
MHARRHVRDAPALVCHAATASGNGLEAMQKLTTACLLLAAAACARNGEADAPAATGAPDLAFESTSHDFGSLSAGTVAEHTFRFTNRGDTALELQQPRGS